MLCVKIHLKRDAINLTEYFVLHKVQSSVEWASPWKPVVGDAVLGAEAGSEGGRTFPEWKGETRLRSWRAHWSSHGVSIWEIPRTVVSLLFFLIPYQVPGECSQWEKVPPCLGEWTEVSWCPDSTALCEITFALNWCHHHLRPLNFDLERETELSEDWAHEELGIWKHRSLGTGEALSLELTLLPGV